jgi:hypothetical protein
MGGLSIPLIVAVSHKTLYPEFTLFGYIICNMPLAGSNLMMTDEDN